MRQRGLSLLVIFFFFLFFIVPFIGSLMFGNIPFVSQYQYSIPSQIPQQPIIGNNINPPSNSTIPNISTPSNNYNQINKKVNYDDSKRHMTFTHIFRDMVILLVVAILAIIWDRLFGNQFLRSFRRRF